MQVPDVLNDPEFQFQERRPSAASVRALGVPLMREDTPIGVLFVACEIEPFTQQQIDLIATFADQAVIAIENTRLFEAEQQRTRELTEFAGAADSHVSGAPGYQQLARQS